MARKKDYSAPDLHDLLMDFKNGIDLMVAAKKRSEICLDGLACRSHCKFHCYNSSGILWEDHDTTCREEENE